MTIQNHNFVPTTRYSVEGLLNIQLRPRKDVSSALLEELFREATQAMLRGPHSVMDKSGCAPSNNKHDYFHPAPYFWPNPDTADGLPYVHRDGRRVPGTLLYEAASDRFDRTRLQRLFDDSLVLSLAWRYGGDIYCVKYASHMLDCFFLDADSRMTPHLRYAQVRYGHNDNLGSHAGVIEMKDLYFYLDAVRLQKQAGVLSIQQLNEFARWLVNYLDWLINSRQGKAESQARNNHGIYYDLQVASIAAYVGMYDVVFKSIERAEERMAYHFAADGSQPLELARNTSAHYCTFNLQGWINFAELARRLGVNFWEIGKGLNAAAHWLCSCDFDQWPYQQIDTFDKMRLMPIEFAASAICEDWPEISQNMDDVRAVFDAHNGIRPFWQL